VRTKQVRLEALVPYERNPRKNEKAVAAVAASLQEFGPQKPIVVDEEMVILAGHTTRLAAMSLGWADYPTNVATGLTEAQKRAYRLADNKTAEIAQWDEELLGLEINELKAFDFDLSPFGFKPSELNGKGKAGLTDPDDVPEVPDTPVTKTGDVWLLGAHRLMCGDCTDLPLVKRLVGDRLVTYTFTSPPYGIDLEYESGATLDELVELIAGSIQVIAAITCDDGYATMNYADVYLSGSPGFTLMSQYYDRPFSQAGWCLRGNRIWAKPFGRLSLSYGTSTTMNLREWEYIQTWRKGRGAEKLRDHGRTLRGIWKTFGDDSIDPDWKDHDETTDKKVHPAAFPVVLPVAGMRAYTDPGDLVFDPFAGSGTTVIACEKVTRPCVAMELAPAYVDVSVRRWQAFTGEQATNEATGKPFPSD
jgi:DNA modification methylase